MVSIGIGVSASYDLIPSARSSALEQRVKESVRGRFPFWYLYRDEASPDDIKFNYELAGVPVIAYALDAAEHQDRSGKIACCGNVDTAQIFDRFVNYFRVKKEFIFVREPEKKNVAATVDALHSALKTDRQIFVAGDCPCADLSLREMTKKDEEADAVLMWNFERDIFGVEEKEHPYHRYFHWRMQMDNESQRFKEPNVYYWDPLKVRPFLNLLHGARKSARGGLNSMILARFWRFPYVASRFVVDDPSSAWKFFRTIVHNVRDYEHKRELQFGETQLMNAFGRLLHGTAVSARHSDFGRIADIDAFQDLWYLEGVVRRVLEEPDHPLHERYHALQMFGESFRQEFRKWILPCHPKFVNEHVMFHAQGAPHPLPYDDEGNFNPKVISRYFSPSELQWGVDALRSYHKVFNAR